MPKHKFNALPDISYKIIESESGKSFGYLYVDNTGIFWAPKNKQKYRKVSFEDFQNFVKEKGKVQ